MEISEAVIDSKEGDIVEVEAAVVVVMSLGESILKIRLLQIHTITMRQNSLLLVHP